MATQGFSFSSSPIGGPADETGIGDAERRPSSLDSRSRAFGSSPTAADETLSTDIEHGSTEPE